MPSFLEGELPISAEIGQAKVATISELSPASGEKPASADLAADLGLPTTGIVDRETFERRSAP